MKAIIFAALTATTLMAYAGEDSTDRWGRGGTGPAFHDTPCGLRGFYGPREQRPCTSTDEALGRDISPAQMREWMEQHAKLMNEMRDEHRAMMGATGGRGTGGAEGGAR